MQTRAERAGAKRAEGDEVSHGREERRTQRTEKIGEVVSTKMAKTIVVQVTRRVPHPLYKRIVTQRKKFYAHDEAGTAKLGDVVRIVESRPLSKLKRWTLGEIVRRAALVGAAKAESHKV